jgi:membrane protein implicated in regulation of membrane protease activity
VRVAIQIFVGLLIISVFVVATFFGINYQLSSGQLVIMYGILFILLSGLMTWIVYRLQKAKLESERKQDEKDR